jgi:hypothetical protein
MVEDGLLLGDSGGDRGRGDDSGEDAGRRDDDCDGDDHAGCGAGEPAHPRAGGASVQRERRSCRDHHMPTRFVPVT